MKNWMNSRGHKKNVVNGKLRQIGVGTHTGTYKKHRDVTMYTADFGARRQKKPSVANPEKIRDQAQC